jgi:SAM-dependent methyltransferase
MTEAMSAEFDTVAQWTARAAIELGPKFLIPAACRGSGSPAVLDWLIEQLDLTAGEDFLDCGAGVGGPTAYAAQQRSIHPTLVEPESGACRAARDLFDYPVVQGSASALPLRDETFAAAWSLGVLCTMPDQLALLTELRRVVRPSGRIGLLVFVARSTQPFEQPEGNHFPTEDLLMRLIDEAGLRIDEWSGTEELPPAPREWQDRVDAVSASLVARHGHEHAWQLAERQSEVIGRLLGDSVVTGELLTLRRQ